MATATFTPYLPTEAQGKHYWDASVHKDAANAEVPTGFPKQIVSPLAWTRTEIESKQSEWKLDLTTDELAAIDRALASFEAQNIDLSSITADTFPLPPAFSQRLRRISDQIYDGVGFQIIHGLDPEKYTPQQNVIVYAGVCAHVCPQRGFVDKANENMICHVVNVQGDNPNAESKAPAFSKSPLCFHTDNCEVMAFYYLDTAVKGGETILTSSWQTYNELAATRPEVLHTLCETWVLDTFKPYTLFPPHHVPLLEKADTDKILLRFSRYPITGWQRQRNPNLPAPTPAQLQALDAVEFTAMANALTLPAVRGDILLVNDMALMHARHGFDEGGVYLKRHLMKMYLRDPEKAWTIPASVEEERAKMYGPNRPDGTRRERWAVLHEPGQEEGPQRNG